MCMYNYLERGLFLNTWNVYIRVSFGRVICASLTVSTRIIRSEDAHFPEKIRIIFPEKYFPYDTIQFNLSSWLGFLTFYRSSSSRSLHSYTNLRPPPSSILLKSREFHGNRGFTFSTILQFNRRTTFQQLSIFFLIIRRAFVYEGFLTHDECDHLIALVSVIWIL